MKRANRIFLAIGFIALIAISWAVVLGVQSADEKQTELIERAEEYLEDKVFIYALPLLEQAAGLNAARTSEAEELLKEVYLELIDQRGMRSKYIDLLHKQMSRPDAPHDVFLETANFHMDNSKYREAFAVLRDGIAKTGNEELVDLYEANRYRYRMSFNTYDDVTAIHGNSIGVSRNGLWGVADYSGLLIIPCEYDKISTYSGDRVIVQKDGEIFAVNRDNNRIALLKDEADRFLGRVSDFGNFASDRLPVLIDGQWYRINGEFLLGNAAFDWIGTHLNGYAAAKVNGKWGVIDSGSTWLIPAEYDGIIMDELGRSYAQGAVFVKRESSVYLFVNGVQIDGFYEDARPFGNEGYAAVMRNGLWGFINTSGEVKIPFQFDDALSFGQHLAAVQQGELWGYVSLRGEIAIEPMFLQAKSFANGNAPVLTERGWRFIALLDN
jgi:hypothetical protein